MAKTVIGLFDSAGEARVVAEELVGSGCRRDDISLVVKDDGKAAVSQHETTLSVIAAGPILARLVGAAGSAIAGSLIGLGVPEDEAHAYAEGIRRGKSLVTVKTSDVAVGPAQKVFSRHDPIDIHSESDRWRAEGWVPVTAQPAPTEMRLHQERVAVERMPPDRPVGDSGRAGPERLADAREEAARVRPEGRVSPEGRTEVEEREQRPHR